MKFFDKGTAVLYELGEACLHRKKGEKVNKKTRKELAILTLIGLLGLGLEITFALFGSEVTAMVALAIFVFLFISYAAYVQERQCTAAEREAEERVFEVWREFVGKD